MTIKKITNRGFAGIEAILLLAVVALIAGTGYYVWKQRSETPKTADAQQASQAAAEEEQRSFQKVDSPYVTNTYVTLRTEADVAKLPDDTPSEFKEYIKSKLGGDEQGCRSVFTIELVSQLNVGGSLHSEDDVEQINKHDNCGGGAQMFWYIDANGQWQEFGTTMVPFCTEFEKRRIYSELAETCLVGEYPDKQETQKNPNGSIADAL